VSAFNGEYMDGGISSLAKVIIFIGAVIMIFGVIVLVLSRLTGGRGAPLPGDIVIRRDHVTIYFPIVTSILISIIITLLFWLISAIRR
jgi:hypothetical protein